MTSMMMRGAPGRQVQRAPGRRRPSRLPRAFSSLGPQHLTETGWQRRDVIHTALVSMMLLGVRPVGAEEPDVTPASPAPSLEASQAAEPVTEVAEPVTQAEELVTQVQEPAPVTDERPVTVAPPQRVYLDVKLEGADLGRVEVELFPDVAVGSARFRDLAVGQAGVGYRLSRFNGVFQTYVRCEGVKSLSYLASMESPIAGGDNLGLLEDELARQARVHDEPGLVSLIVGEAEARPTKERVIARDGKLVTITQQFGEAPNGTGFTITLGAEPSLDATNLIVGRVVGGLDVVQAIGNLPYARPRDSYYDKPFFSVAKAIGDRRADTAAKGFNRPLKRVIVSAAGLL